MIEVQKTLTESQQVQIMSIWNRVYPAQLVHTDLNSWKGYEQKLVNPFHYIWETEGQLQAWMATFDRDGKRYFVLIIDEEAQGKGLGSHLMKFVQARESELWGLVIDHDRYVCADGKAYLSPLGFYQKLGFNVMHDSRWENEQISAVKMEWKRNNDG